MPGIVDVDTTLQLDKPELLVHIDRERAAALGVDVQEIAETLRVAVGGDDRVSRYRDAALDDAYDVELRLVGVDRGDAQSISQLYVRAKPGAQARVARRRWRRRAARDDVVLTRLDNVVQFQRRQQPVAHRPPRPAADGRRAGERAPAAMPWATASRRCGRRAEELGLPPG